MRQTLACFASLILLSTQLKAQDPVVQSIMNAVSIDSLMYNAGAISGEFAVGVNGGTSTIASRNKLNAGNALAADYLQQRLQLLGYTTSVQTFGAAGENVLATLPGLLYPNQKVILCGHYDSMPTGAVSPAADDDGSGTAAVIEAARVLANQTFAYTIVLALWDEEEYGLTGSAYYATQALAAQDSIIGVVNMDAIAFDSDGDETARVHTRPIANSVAISDLVVYMNTAYGINLDLQVNNPGATYSDHASFWNKGYGAVLMIEDFDNDGNPHYHTTTDRVQYFDQGYFHKLARLSIGLAASLAIPYSIAIGVDDVDTQPTLWPNPANNAVNVRLGGMATGRCQLQLTDLLGHTVWSQQTTDQQVVIELAAYPAGMYTLSVSNGAKTAHQRLAIGR